MRISDWSSDVCSSDLLRLLDIVQPRRPFAVANTADAARDLDDAMQAHDDPGRGNYRFEWIDRHARRAPNAHFVIEPGLPGVRVSAIDERSEERRVGKACVSTGRARGGAYN